MSFNERLPEGLRQWTPAIVASVLCIMLAVSSCERLRPVEPVAREVIEHGDQVCVLLPDEEDVKVCGESFELARLVTAIVDSRNPKPAPTGPVPLLESGPSLSVSVSPLRKVGAGGRGGAP